MTKPRTEVPEPSIACAWEDYHARAGRAIRIWWDAVLEIYQCEVCRAFTRKWLCCGLVKTFDDCDEAMECPRCHTKRFGR